MKKLFLFFFSFSALIAVNAQGIKGSLIKLAKKDSGSALSKVAGNLPSGGGSLSNDEIVKGLREALSIGTNNSTIKLNKADGFFANAAIKILMPEEAKKVEKTLRNFGMSSLVDKAVLSMNRAAEDASGAVSSIFLDAIKNMSLQDGLSILKGNDFAATEFLKKNTTASLTEKMRPVIQASLDKVNASSYWKDVFTAYNRVSAQKVNPDLNAYVTSKAMEGIFHEIGLEEQKIRKNPAAQVTELLKKVFGK